MTEQSSQFTIKWVRATQSDVNRREEFDDDDDEDDDEGRMIVTAISISYIYLVVSGHHRTNLSISTQICVTCESGYYTTLTTYDTTHKYHGWILDILFLIPWEEYTPLTFDLIVGAGWFPEHYFIKLKAR